MAKTYIIGHQKPDTDSVVAALALAYLFEQDSSFGYDHVQAAIIEPINGETVYLLDRFKLPAPQIISAQDIKPDDKVVLVDHNEASQRLVGLNPDQIVEIVDHHKVNLDLSQPIYLNFKTWGSSTSVVYFMMRQLGQTPVKPNQQLASLMLAAILSDTVGFKSSTTTRTDIKLAHELADLAQIDDLDQLTLDIFKAKSNLTGLTPEQLVKNDYKIFKFAKKVLIGQLETVEQDSIIQKQKQKLLTAMQVVKEQEQVELIFLAITDILKVNTKLLILDSESEAVATAAFGGTVVNNVLDIGPKLSRKKDIAPQLEKSLMN